MKHHWVLTTACICTVVVNAEAASPFERACCRRTVKVCLSRHGGSVNQCGQGRCRKHDRAAAPKGKPVPMKKPRRR